MEQGAMLLALPQPLHNLPVLSQFPPQAPPAYRNCAPELNSWERPGHFTQLETEGLCARKPGGG